MEAVIEFLRDRLGFDDAMVFSVVRQFAPALTTSIDATLEPAVKFLTEELGIGGEGIARIVRAFLAILALDVEQDMRPNVDFFRARWLWDCW